MLSPFREHKAVVVLVLVLVLVIFGTLILTKNKKTGNEQEDSLSIEESSEQLSRIVKDYSKSNQEYVQQKIDTVKSLSDLRVLEEEEQGIVGVRIIQYHIEQGRVTEAKEYIDYLMKRDDGWALEATHACYKIAVVDQERNECLQRMNELARAQGIIEPSATLPPSYYEFRDGELE